MTAKIEEHVPQWIKDFPKVAHYTTYSGLAGILATNQMWATHFCFLNDRSEMQHGQNYINKICQEIDPQNQSNLETVWQKGLRPNENDPELFVTSFSGIPSDNIPLETDGLLSQWKEYGRNSGFAIIFDSYELYKSYLSFSKQCKTHPGRISIEGCPDCLIHFHSYLFMPVLYQHNLEEIKKNNEVYSAINFYLNKITSAIKTGVLLDSEGIDDFIKAIMYLILALKHPAFHEENEIRFACLNRLENIQGNYHQASPYEIKIEGQTPRLKIDFLPTTIKKIIIGPQNNQDQMKINIKYLLERHSNKNIEIIKSTIPFIF